MLWLSALVFLLQFFIYRFERKSGDAHIYAASRFTPSSNRLRPSAEQTSSALCLFGPVLPQSVLRRAPIRTGVRLCCTISCFPSFRFTCGFLVNCVIIKICGFFFWICCNFSCGKTHRIIHKVSITCFANSNEMHSECRMSSILLALKVCLSVGFFYKVCYSSLTSRCRFVFVIVFCCLTGFCGVEGAWCNYTLTVYCMICYSSSYYSLL